MGRRLFYAGVFVALLVGGWSFAHNHAAPVTLDWWLDQRADVPLWAALLGAFVAGVLLTAALAAVELARLALTGRRYRAAIRGLEDEVHQLRNLPLAEEPDASSGRDAGPAVAAGERGSRR